MNPERPRRVVVFRALQLGDMLCAVPALRALRGAWPEAEIVLVGLPWARGLVGRFGCYLDGFREFPGYPGLPEQDPALERLPEFLAAIRREQFDLAIQLHGSGGITNRIVNLFGARSTAGYFVSGQDCPDSRFFRPYPDSGTEVRRLLDLCAFLGAPPRGEHLEFPILDEDREEFGRIAAETDLEPGSYVCIHPGASVPERRWPAAWFASVADSLAGRGLRIVLTGTPGERELTRAVGRAMRAEALDLAGRTSLGSLGALLEGARLLVCNDTGVSHMAAALYVPSVVLAPAANIARWAPSDRQRHRVLTQESSPREALAEAEALLCWGQARAG